MRGPARMEPLAQRRLLGGVGVSLLRRAHRSLGTASPTAHARPAAQRLVVACGRGRDICHPAIREQIIALTGKAQPALLYIGTPAFEAADARRMQTEGFKQAGCAVTELKLTEPSDIPSGAPAS